LSGEEDFGGPLCASGNRERKVFPRPPEGIPPGTDGGDSDRRALCGDIGTDPSSDFGRDGPQGNLCLPAGYGSVAGCGKDGSPVPPDSAPSGVHPGSGERGRRGRSRRRSGEGDPQGRSEEHTSELQSRENLVCRLLLEKKKTRDTRG